MNMDVAIWTIQAMEISAPSQAGIGLIPIGAKANRYVATQNAVPNTKTKDQKKLSTVSR